MSRTSKTLLRLGVPGLAAVTMLAGAPAFLGAAQAAPIGSITLTPVDGSSTAAAGSCQAYFVDATAATAGTSTAGETVNVTLLNSSNGNDPNNVSADASFCTLPQNGSTPQAGTIISTGGPNGGTPTTASRSDQARFTLGQGPTGNELRGRVVIGVTRNVPGSVEVRAFSDLNGNNTFDVANNEVQSATTTTTFTAGGEDGGNENQNAANTVEVLSSQNETATRTVRTNDSDTVVQNEARQFRVLVTNGVSGAATGTAVTGDALEAVTVSFDVIGGNNTIAAGVFAVTNNDGIATGTISLPNVGAGTQVRFFVNQSDNPGGAPGTTTGADAGEPQDVTIVNTAQSQAASTLNLVPLQDVEQGTNTDANGTNTGGTFQTNPAINPRTDRDRTFRVLVDNASDNQNNSQGRLIGLTVTGGSGDETLQCATNNTGATSTTPNATGAGIAERNRVDCATSNNPFTTTSTTDSFVDVIVDDPTPRSGEVLTIVANVRGSSTSDTETLSYVAVPSDARNVDLTPETTTTAAGAARTFTARVIDASGQPVFNVFLVFEEDGPGAFRSGLSAEGRFTDRNGVATIDAVAVPGEAGVQTITVTMNQTAFTTQAAGTPFGNTRAGNRVDTAVNNINATGTPAPTATATGTAQPTATPTATTAPTGTATPTPTGTVSPPPGTTCVNPAGISLSRSFITPGVPVTVTVTAPEGAVIELQAYSRPSTDYRQVRQGVVGSTGRISFDVTPGTNTRIFAACVGQTRSASASQVINVRTALSLTVVRNGSRNYTFQGRILPRRAGQLITLYRITNSGQRILTSQIKTDNSGTYRINRRFTGSGTFGFLTRTGQTLTNAAGESNTPNTVEGVTNGRGNARPTAIF